MQADFERGGAIARFHRGSIELRVMDVQEYREPTWRSAPRLPR